jgi:arginase
MSRNRGIDIIGVPLDLGVKELGLRLGPDTFREAGLVQIARRLKLDIRDLGNMEIHGTRENCADLDCQVAQIAACCESLAERVAESVRAGRIPVCLGGDHSLAIGSVAGVSSEIGKLGCLWIDAHPDANTPETSPTGNVHGMPVAILLGHGPERLVNVKRPGPKIAAEHLSITGTRDIDPGEAEFIRKHAIQMFTVFDVLEQGLSAVMDHAIERVSGETAGVHVSFDLDVLHEDIAPGVGLASRYGFDMREAAYVCRRLADRCPIVSIDLIGLNPVRDRNMRTARFAIELLLMMLGQSFSFSYDDYLRGV